jgi:two-component system, OmpR family, sensor histidine kinase KdpD
MDGHPNQRRNKQELYLEIARLAAQVKQLEQDSDDEHALRIEAQAHAHRESLELAMTVHELRTPLAGIIGHASTILSTDVMWSDEQIEEFVIIIADEADKMKLLLDDLVEVIRTKATQPTLRRAPVSLEEILTTAKSELRTIAPNHRLSEVVPENLPKALADRQRIAQVLVNLVRNAVEHSPAETTIKIVGSTEQQTMIRIDVSDEGAGIPSDALSTVFAAFKRGDSDEIQEGVNLGLGLAICKAIIEAHGGRIWAEDHEGHGTRLSFTLPTADSSAP